MLIGLTLLWVCAWEEQKQKAGLMKRQLAALKFCHVGHQLSHQGGKQPPQAPAAGCCVQTLKPL